MNNYVQVYHNVIDPGYCDELIEKFNGNPRQHDRREEDLVSFTEIHLYKHSEWEQDVQTITQVYIKYLKQYRKEFNIIDAMWPKMVGMEGFRIKKYLPNDKDEFKPHVDSFDKKSSFRFLAFFVYLDDNKGGQTSFPQLDLRIPCTKGSLLIFPPLWLWLHSGEKPVDKPKYILGSYLHYGK